MYRLSVTFERRNCVYLVFKILPLVQWLAPYTVVYLARVWVRNSLLVALGWQGRAVALDRGQAAHPHLCNHAWLRSNAAISTKMVQSSVQRQLRFCRNQFNCAANTYNI